MPATAAPVTHYENFPVASLLCPPHLRAPIAALYAFARTADDIADEGDATPAQRLHDLVAYRAELAAVAAGAAPGMRWATVFGPLQGVLRQHGLPAAPLDDLLSAFVQDVEKTRDGATYADRTALLDYCRRSANPVGRLLLHLYGVADAEALAQSDAICSALQLIRFWQDLSVDIPRGRHYLTGRRLRRPRRTAPSWPRRSLRLPPRACWPTTRAGRARSWNRAPRWYTACRAAQAGNCVWWCKAGCASSTRSTPCGAPTCTRAPGCTAMTGA